MNVERLKASAELLLQWEDELKIQGRLEELNAALTNMANSLQDPARQVEVATKLDDLEKTLRQLDHDSAETKMLISMGAFEYFSRDIAATVRELIAANPMTPAVVQQHVGTYLKQRKVFLQRLQTLNDTLAAIGVAAETVEEGSAEIGFQIPRDLFQNHLDGLIKELGVIKRIVRAFSELATGAAEPIEIKQISTSDPLFSFALDPITISALGAAVTWALHTWKQVEDIRKTRAETQKLKSFTPDEIESFFGAKVKATITQAIEEKTTELIGARDGKAGRKEEQRTDIRWALESIFARIERGMTVEIRFLAPPAAKQDDVSAGDESSVQQAVFEQLKEIKPQLVFPAPEDNPILALPAAEPKGKTESKTKAGQ